MMIVRFPSGFSVQYNTANYAQRSTAYTDLYEKEGGRWIAQVPNEAIIEVVPACRTYFAAAPDNTLSAKLDTIAKELRSIKRKVAVKP